MNKMKIKRFSVIVLICIFIAAVTVLTISACKALNKADDDLQDNTLQMKNTSATQQIALISAAVSEKIHGICEVADALGCEPAMIRAPKDVKGITLRAQNKYYEPKGITYDYVDKDSFIGILNEFDYTGKLPNSKALNLDSGILYYTSSENESGGRVVCRFNLSIISECAEAFGAKLCTESEIVSGDTYYTELDNSGGLYVYMTALPPESKSAGSSVYLTVIILAAIAAAAASVTAVIILMLPEKSIKKLTVRINSAVAGDFANPVEITSDGELGELEGAVSKLMQRLDSGLSGIAEELSAISDGNLSDKNIIACGGEFDSIRSHIAKIRYNLGETISRIKQSSDAVYDGADKISSSCGLLADNCSKHSIAASELSEHIAAARDSFEESSRSVKRTERAVENANKTLYAERTKLNELSAAIAGINNHADEISAIIGDIEDVAFQTNILALNAAVEAARAGEDGKGFAVVADEVRNLAQKSSGSAQSSAQIIKDTIKSVSDGVRIARETAALLEEATENMLKAEKFVGEIKAASSKQEAEITALSDDLNDISNILKLRNDTAQNGISSSDSIKNQASDLQSIAGSYTL